MERLSGCAEVFKKRLQGRIGDSGRNHSVVITRDGKNRSRVVTVWVIELIVIVLSFAEAIYYIAQIVAERWHILRFGLIEVADQFVGDHVHIFGTAGISGIADRMKDDLTCLFDCAHDLLPFAAYSIRQRHARLNVGRDGERSRFWCSFLLVEDAISLFI